MMSKLIEGVGFLCLAYLPVKVVAAEVLAVTVVAELVDLAEVEVMIVRKSEFGVSEEVDANS
jgi:hypothetical protein